MDKNKYSDYSDFLKDRTFIRWQLVPDPSLNNYWEEYMMENPEKVQAMQRAAEYLKTDGLNKKKLGKEDCNRLFFNIKTALRNNEKKRQLRRVTRYAVAMSILLFIGGITFYRLSPLFRKSEVSLITGNILEEQHIQLITGSGSVTFGHNIQMEIDEKGEAKIRYATETEETEETEETVKTKEASETVKIAPGKMNRLIVPFGKRTVLSLADGSKIWLNSGSEIEFPSRFTEKKREIRLISGEIYAEISPDAKKPFYVQTSGFSIKVYGTKFNISAYSPSDQSVVLIEGEVGIQAADQKEIRLKPDEQAIAGEGGAFSTRKVNGADFIGWKNGFFTFRETPIEEVLHQIGRYYNIRFDYTPEIDLKGRNCTGKIYLSDHLENVMATIALLSDTKYEIHRNTIRIFNNPNE